MRLVRSGVAPGYFHLIPSWPWTEELVPRHPAGLVADLVNEGWGEHTLGEDLEQIGVG